MIRINPGLRSSSTVAGDQYNNVLGPERPSLEIICQCQCKSHSALVQFPIHVCPGSKEHNCLSSISPRCVKDGIDILTDAGIARSVVFVTLPRRYQIGGPENVTELLVNPKRSRLLAEVYCSESPAYIRFLILACQSFDLVHVGVEDVLFAPSKIGVHLAREKSILRYVRASRISVEREQAEPEYPYKDA